MRNRIYYKINIIDTQLKRKRVFFLLRQLYKQIFLLRLFSLCMLLCRRHRNVRVFTFAEIQGGYYMPDNVDTYLSDNVLPYV